MRTARRNDLPPRRRPSRINPRRRSRQFATRFAEKLGAATTRRRGLNHERYPTKGEARPAAALKRRCGMCNEPVRGSIPRDQAMRLKKTLLLFCARCKDSATVFDARCNFGVVPMNLRRAHGVNRRGQAAA